MKVVKIIKWDKNNKVAWCDNGLGFFIRPGYKVEVGQLINTDVHFIEAEMNKIKQSIKELSKAGRPRIFKYKEWLLEIFEDRNEIPVWKLRAAATEKGFSWQMVQKARANDLDEMIKPTFLKRKGGWCWIDIRGKA